MTDHDLTRLLRSLPRHPARTDLARRVLERLDRDDRGGLDEDAPRSGAWILFTGPARRVVAALLVLAAVAVGARFLPEPRGGADRPAPGAAAAAPAGAEREAARLDRLASEHRALERELAELRRRAMEPGPVLFLDGDDRFDLVVDLDRLSGGDPVVRPAHRAGVRPTFY